MQCFTLFIQSLPPPPYSFNVVLLPKPFPKHWATSLNGEGGFDYARMVLGTSVSTVFRVPKGFRAPGLQPKKMQGSRAPRGKIWGSRAPLLHSRAPFSQKQHFCLGSKWREALGSGLHYKNFRAPVLQRPPFGTLSFSCVWGLHPLKRKLQLTKCVQLYNVWSNIFFICLLLLKPLITSKAS